MRLDHVGKLLLEMNPARGDDTTASRNLWVTRVWCRADSPPEFCGGAETRDANRRGQDQKRLVADDV